MGLHAVQFGNISMGKIFLTVKIGLMLKASSNNYGREFFNPITSRLDKHVVLLRVNYMVHISIVLQRLETVPTISPWNYLHLYTRNNGIYLFGFNYGCYFYYKLIDQGCRSRLSNIKRDMINIEAHILPRPYSIILNLVETMYYHPLPSPPPPPSPISGVCE